MVLSARAPNPGAKPTAEAVERRVMSKWCPGVTLADCPSSQADALRRDIAARVAQGWTNRRIDAWLVADYGEGILGRPRSTAAFLVPALAALVGSVAVASVLRRRRPPPPHEPGPGSSGPPGPDPADADMRRLEADLRRFSGEATE